MEHILKAEPCYNPSDGGLFTCQHCGESYCYPPWILKEAQKDHLQSITPSPAPRSNI